MMKKAVNVVGSLGIFFFIFGILLKIQHWPGGGPFYLIGQLLLILLVPILIVGIFRNTVNRSRAISYILLITLVVGYIGMVRTIKVDNDILDNFIIINRGIELSTSNIEAKKDSLLLKLNDNSKADSIDKASNNLQSYIDELKLFLIEQVDGPPEEVEVSDNIEAIRDKDNYDIPTHILIGDPDNMRSGLYTAKELKEQIIAFRKLLFSQIEHEDSLILAKGIDLNTNDIYNKEEGTATNWEQNNFYHVPMAAVITILSKIQMDVINAEIQALLALDGSHKKQTSQKGIK